MSQRLFSFEVNRSTTATPEVLFRLESHGPLWARWGRPLVWQAGWVHEGDPAPAGVGAIRKLGLWPVLVQERTVEYDPPRKHVYTLIYPRVLVRNYRAELLLTPNPTGGTDLRWQGRFEAARRTGPAARAVLRAVIGMFADRLIRAAER